MPFLIVYFENNAPLIFLLGVTTGAFVEQRLLTASVCLYVDAKVKISTIVSLHAK